MANLGKLLGNTQNGWKKGNQKASIITTLKGRIRGMEHGGVHGKGECKQCWDHLFDDRSYRIGHASMPQIHA